MFLLDAKKGSYNSSYLLKLGEGYWDQNEFTSSVCSYINILFYNNQHYLILLVNYFSTKLV